MKGYEVSVAVHSKETGMFLFRKFFHIDAMDDETISEVLEDIEDAARRGRLFAMPRLICRDSGIGYYLHGITNGRLQPTYVSEMVSDRGVTRRRTDNWVRVGPSKEFGNIQDVDAYDIVVNVIPAPWCGKV